MLGAVNHILGLSNIRRSRVLPINGKVLVRVGQKVNASDVIAEALLPSRHILYDIRRSLGLTQTDELEQAIVRREGDMLAEGDVIAEGSGLFKKVVRTSENARVVSTTGGRVLLEAESKKIELKAGLPGTVTELLKERGAMIETNGALVQGAWGNGKIDQGLLVVLITKPEDELARGMLEVSFRGAMVLAGHCADAEVLRMGAELPLRGLVLTSMASELIPLASSLDYPIMVLEGFGNIPMNEAAFKLLTTNEKRDAALNAGYNPARGERPELILPLPAVGEPAPEIAYFAPNQVVRIQGAPYQSKIGTIVQVRPGFTVLPNGLRAPAADVRLEQDAQVIVPLANLEVIG